jgi:hypothetical protein
MDWPALRAARLGWSHLPAWCSLACAPARLRVSQSSLRSRTAALVQVSTITHNDGTQARPPHCSPTVGDMDAGTRCVACAAGAVVGRRRTSGLAGVCEAAARKLVAVMAPAIHRGCCALCSALAPCACGPGTCTAGLAVDRARRSSSGRATINQRRCAWTTPTWTSRNLRLPVALQRIRPIVSPSALPSICRSDLQRASARGFLRRKNRAPTSKSTSATRPSLRRSTLPQ